MSFIKHEENAMIRLSDELTATLAEAGEGLKVLQEEVITAGFDPDDPASVQAAIQHVEDTIDGKIARFRGNALVREAADQIKAECRANILQQVEGASTNRGSRTLH
jgi:hypothetical protein